MDERRARPARTPVQDRRIGERYRAAPIPILWKVEDKRGFRRGRSEPAEMVDVSLTGAGIVATPDDRIALRHRVRVDWDGARAVVEIRHVGAGPVPGTSYYGVNFREMEPHFAELLDRRIAAERPSSVEALRPTDD